MKDAVWALIVLGAAVGFAGETTRDQSAPAAAESKDTLIDSGKAAAAGQSLAEKRTELKELEARAIDEMDEQQLERRLRDARQIRLERQALDELGVIANQLTKLANDHPNTVAGARARAVSESLIKANAFSPSQNSTPPAAGNTIPRL